MIEGPKPSGKFGSPTWTRTRDNSINSRMLYQLSYRGMWRGYSRGFQRGKALSNLLDGIL